MTTRRRRKCRHCGQLFRPDPRNLRHQRYCSAKECRRASKTASQRRWLAKAENRDYFRGPEQVARVAESIIGLYKTEVIRPRGPWRGLEAVEFATLEWVDWFNNRRLFETIGNRPPAEAEAAYHRQTEHTALAA